MKSLVTMLTFVFLSLVVLPGFASAQTSAYPQRACIDGTPHATTTNRVGTVTTTTPNIVCSVNCIEECKCDRGYHMAGSLTNGDPRCVRNVPGDRDGDGYVSGSYQEPLCALGSVRGAGGECTCPAELGARQFRSLKIVSRAFAATIADQIENYASLRRGRDSVALQVCTDPMATGMMPNAPDRVMVDALDQRYLGLCRAPEGATNEQVRAACNEVGEFIHSLRGQRPGSVTITHVGRTYTVQEFVDQVIVLKFGEIAETLRTLGETVAGHTEMITDLDRRVDVLEARPTPAAPGSDGRNSVTMAVGAFGLYGFHMAGPATAAGGLSLALHLRPGLAPLDIYARVGLGGQYTGHSVGGSPYVSAAAGVSIYLGGSRRKTMLQLGLWGEDLWDPASDPAGDIQADSIGWSFGVEVALSIPLHPNARLVLGVAVGGGERRYLSNGTLAVLNGAVIQPFLRLEALLPSF